MNTALRPMSTSEILDRTFNLYRNNFLLFAGIPILPPALKVILDVLQLLSNPMTPSPNGTIGIGSRGGELTGAQVGGGLLLLLVYLFGAIMASSATVYAVSMVYLGKPVTIGGSYSGIWPRIGRLIGLFLMIVIIMVGLGLVVIGIPLLIFRSVRSPELILVIILVGLPLLLHLYVCLSLAPAVCIVENAGVIQSLNRSMALTRGTRGRIWLVFLLTFVIQMALGFAIGIPVGIVSVTTHSIALTTTLVLISNFFVSTLVAPILTIPLVLMYYDQRVRKEAFDLQLMMEALGQPLPAQANTATPI